MFSLGDADEDLDMYEIDGFIVDYNEEEEDNPKQMQKKKKKKKRFIYLLILCNAISYIYFLRYTDCFLVTVSEDCLNALFLMMMILS